jgi:hypothetical protein
MNDQFEQVTNYIKQQLQAGDSKENIRHTLLQYNWDANLVDQALSHVMTSTPQPMYAQGMGPASPQDIQPNHTVRNGILWILSPFIVLVGLVIINFLIRLAGISSPILNILTVLGGMAGVVLLFVGPIVGTVKLASHK